MWNNVPGKLSTPFAISPTGVEGTMPHLSSDTSCVTLLPSKHENNEL